MSKNTNANKSANAIVTGNTNATMLIDNPAEQISWEYVSCNLCGRVDTEIYHHERLKYFDTELDFTIVRCRNCGLVYTNPRISQHNATYLASGILDPQQVEHHAQAKIPVFKNALEHIKRLQKNITTKNNNNSNSDSNSDSNVNINNNNDNGDNNDSDNKNENINENMNENDKSATLLDIGCGCGHFVAAANNANYNACGLEPAGPAGDYAQHNLGIKLIRSDVTRAQIAPASFDVITAWDVIEHVPDPLGMLRCCKTWLKPGGIAAFRFPSARWQKIKGIILHSLLASHRPAFAPTIHLYFFSEHTFARMAKQAGLKVIFAHTTPLELNSRNTILDSIKCISNRIIKTVETTSKIKLGNLEIYCTTE